MAKSMNGGVDINNRLQDAIEELRRDVTKVEVWATALSSFAQPVPDYRPDEKFRLGKALKGDAE